MKKTQFYLWIILMATSMCTPKSNSSRTVVVQPLSERMNRIKMTDLNGKSINMQDLVGKPVFLNFWATWCKPCVSEMQSIEEASKKFKNDIVFLAASNEESSLIRSFVEKKQFSFRFARLDIPYIDLFVISLPTTFLIDSHGQLVAEEEGFRLWTEPANLEKLASLTKR